MTFNQRKYGIGIFHSPQRAIQAFNELRSTGFPMNKISAIANAPVRDEQLGYIDTLGLTQISHYEPPSVGAYSYTPLPYVVSVRKS